MMVCGFNFPPFSSETEILFTHFLKANLDSSDPFTRVIRDLNA